MSSGILRHPAKSLPPEETPTGKNHTKGAEVRPPCPLRDSSIPAFPLAFLQMDREQGDISRGDAADSTGLTERGRPNFAKFLSSLNAQSADVFVVEPVGNAL